MSTTDHFNQIGIDRLPGHLGIVITHVGPTEVHAQMAMASCMRPA